MDAKLDSKDLAIGILSTTAVILFVGVLIVSTRPQAALASGMTARGGDYILTVGRDASGDEELVYVIDAPSQRLVVYRFDSNRHEIEIVQGIELDKLRSAAGPGAQGPGRRPGSRRQRP